MRLLKHKYLRKRHLRIGRRGENIAVHYLVAHGMTILSRNWRCRIGELDIVAIDNRELVCIEVKTRRAVRGSQFITFDNIDLRKCRKLRAVFARYQTHHAAKLKRMALRSTRIDGIGVTVGRWPILSWFAKEKDLKSKVEHRRDIVR